MWIHILHILIASNLLYPKSVQSNDNKERMKNLVNVTEDKAIGHSKTLLNSVIISATGNKKPRNLSNKKRMKRRRSYELSYHHFKPCSITLTENLKNLLTEKEHTLKWKGILHNWEDFIISPLPDNQGKWNDFCRELWPGLPGFIVIHKKLARCDAKFHSMQTDDFRNKRGSHFIGHLHDFVPGHEGWSFRADFLSCECKYVSHCKSKKAIPNTSKYFFAMKLAEMEYFLLTHADPTMKKALGLKIIGFRSFKETDNESNKDNIHDDLPMCSNSNMSLK